MRLTTLCFVFALLFSFHASFAQEPVVAPSKKGAPVKFLIAAALELGGDKVAYVEFTDGSTQSMRAGQGGTIAVGAQFQFPQQEKLLLRGTIGLKYLGSKADNANIRLTRIPLQLTANWMAAKKLRLAAGIVSHRNIRVNFDGIGDNFKFRPATGPVFEIAYSVVGLSFTAMKYKDEDNNSFSANAIGLTLSGVLGKK